MFPVGSTASSHQELSLSFQQEVPLCSQQEVLLTPSRKYHCVLTRKYCFVLGPANHGLNLEVSKRKSFLIKNTVYLGLCVCLCVCVRVHQRAGVHVSWPARGGQRTTSACGLSWPSVELLFINPCELQASRCIGSQGWCLPLPPHCRGAGPQKDPNSGPYTCVAKPFVCRAVSPAHLSF